MKISSGQDGEDCVVKKGSVRRRTRWYVTASHLVVTVVSQRERRARARSCIYIYIYIHVRARVCERTEKKRQKKKNNNNTSISKRLHVYRVRLSTYINIDYVGATVRVKKFNSIFETPIEYVQFSPGRRIF